MGISIIVGLLCLHLALAFQNRTPHKFNQTRGINESSWRKRIPASNLISSRKVELGRMLFFDKRLSINGTISCANCHDPAVAFTDSQTVALGAGGKLGTRNTPTVLNAAFSQALFWDGRARSLEEQATHPLLNSSEMGMGSAEGLTKRLAAIPEYRRQFTQVFKSEGITIDTIAKAIAAYERTLLSANSPFDRFLAGNNTAISDAQKRGWQLFKGKAKCIECHTHSRTNPLFTDFKFHNTGVAAVEVLFDKLVAESAADTDLSEMAHSEGFSELGRFAVTRRQADIGAFKTPTLRDVELTSPYMHNGSLRTLIDVVQYYNRGGHTDSHLDQLMQPLHLSDDDVNDLVQFMRALTSNDVLRVCQTTRPQTRTAVPVR